VAASEAIVTPAVSGRALPAPPGAAGIDLHKAEREAAIRRLFDGHYPQLVQLAALTGADEDAEDIVEDAFCELYWRWHRLRDPSAALLYLRSVICNLTRMRLRHLQVVRRHRQEPRADADSAESVALLREDQREVIEALERLPGRQREALVLRYWLGLREAEVAHQMGISRGAVKAHTSRAIAGLKPALEAQR
jgi:RNA polymerase sigma-70 factor (sigma-E family)